MRSFTSPNSCACAPRAPGRNTQPDSSLGCLLWVPARRLQKGLTKPVACHSHRTGLRCSRLTCSRPGIELSGGGGQTDLYEARCKPARMACSAETARVGNRSRSSWAAKFATRSAAVGSLPRRTLVAISHGRAPLTWRMFLVSAIALRAALLNAGLSDSHQSSARVSKSTRMENYSQPANSSAGRSSKNSGPTISWPFSEPGTLLPLTSPMGTRRATGV